MVIQDARSARNGRAIEEIGLYHPKEEPSRIEVDSARVQYWLGVGAQPTEPVVAILKVTGDWQKFKGLPGAEGTLKVAPAKQDRREIFAAAVKDAAVAKDEAARAPKLEKPAKAEKPVAEPVVEEVQAEVAPAEPVATETPEVEAPAAAEAEVAETTEA